MPATLRIELDAPAFRAGGPVTGVVVVDVEEDARSEGVLLDLDGWAGGRGHLDRERWSSFMLQGSTSWRAGQQVRLPFAIDTPPFPVTHRGALVKVGWRLTARAVVAWRHTATGQDVVLLPGRPAEEHLASLALESAPQARRTRRTWGFVGLAALCGGLLLLGGAALFGVEQAAGSRVALAAAAAAGLLGALRGLRNLVAERKLGPVELSVTDRVAAGDALAIDLSFRPPEHLVLNGARAVLACVERCRGPSEGLGREEQRERELEVTLHEGGFVPGRRTCRLTGHIPLPPDAAPSFKSPHAEIAWTLSLHVDIPDWPDWVLDVGIAVLPCFERRVVTVRRTARVAIQPAQRCPYCRDGLAGTRANHLAVCPGCRTAYHDECLEELGRCAIPGCPARRTPPRGRA